MAIPVFLRRSPFNIQLGPPDNPEFQSDLPKFPPLPVCIGSAFFLFVLASLREGPAAIPSRHSVAFAPQASGAANRGEHLLINGAFSLPSALTGSWLNTFIQVRLLAFALPPQTSPSRTSPREFRVAPENEIARPQDENEFSDAL